MKRGELEISLKSLISVRWEKYFPRLVIHEKYEKKVKWTLRILTCIGILGSLIAFPIWYASLSFAVLLLLIEQFFERAVFEYTSIYVQPLPEFSYDPDKWKGMSYAFPQDPDPHLLNVVGCAFSTSDYANKFFNLMRSWNYNEKEDKDNNICLSFIVESENEYSVYLYPNPERRTVGEFFGEVEEERKLEKHGKQHQQLIMHMLFCKIFPYGENSQLKIFITKQRKDRPFWLQPFIMDENGHIDILYDIEPILKYHFKFKNRSELIKKEIEYHHGKNIMRK